MLRKVLVKLKEFGIDQEDLMAYADDLLVLCDSPDQLVAVTKTLKAEVQNLGLILNAKKSGIVEFMGRRKKRRLLNVGEEVEGIEVMRSYKYLGLYLDEKLSVHTHLAKMKERMILQAEALSKVIFNFSAGYRKNLWMMLVKPLFDFPALLCVAEKSKTNIELVERLCRKSFKRMVGIDPRMKNEWLEMFSGYKLQERGDKLWSGAEEKWRVRKMKMRVKVDTRAVRTLRKEDLLAYIPGEVISLLNIYTRMCPRCSGRRLSPAHLSTHGIEVPDPIEMVRRINEDIIEKRKECIRRREGFERVKSMKVWGEMCERYVKTIQSQIYRKMEVE
ncbi:MAG: hypothetical protein EOO43_18985 [Flavobacterium sp.]|nr:MAG: hypothetical protein EOO43_18985 [Flavobacterium sp.]